MAELQHSASLHVKVQQDPLKLCLGFAADNTTVHEHPNGNSSASPGTSAGGVQAAVAALGFGQFCA